MTSANAARAAVRRIRDARELADCRCSRSATTPPRPRGAVGFRRGRCRRTARWAIWCGSAATRFARWRALLYLAGEDRAGDLAGELAERGIAVETVVIYRAVAARALPAERDAGAVGADSSTACCITPGAAPRPAALAGAGRRSLTRCSVLRIIVCPMRWRRRCAKPGAGGSRSRRGPNEAALIGLFVSKLPPSRRRSMAGRGVGLDGREARDDG